MRNTWPSRMERQGNTGSPPTRGKRSRTKSRRTRRIAMAASSPLPDPKWKIARSFPRFATALAATVHLVVVGEAAQLSGTMQDVGLGGACVVLEVGNLMPRQKVLLEFRFPMTVEPLRLKATVRHCHHENH